MAQLLFIDLDGTFFRSDMLFESLFQRLKKQPLVIFLIPFWLFRGRPYLKARLAQNLDFPISTVPVNQELYFHLKTEKAKGDSRIILITASAQTWADQVKKAYPIFDEAIGSDLINNLKAEQKLLRIKEIAGTTPYAYAGDSKADLCIWSAADEAIVVNAKPSLISEARQKAKVSHIFDERKNPLHQFAKALRLHQWSKNVLIFVPMFAGHVFSLHAILTCATAWACFSLCASSVYLLNDLLDLESDRAHRSKKNRPLAAANFPISLALFLIPLLLGLSFSIARFLEYRMYVVLTGYFLLTLLYSVWLKKIVMIDIVVLSLLYTVRMLAGGIVLNIPVSNWLLSFSVFLFLSLAFIKRYSELLALRQQKIDKAQGRGFHTADLEIVANLGVSSGLVSVMVILLYFNSDSTQALYRNPNQLWLITPAIIYWIARIWIMASRGLIHDDPVVYTMKDRLTYLILAYVGAIMFLAI